MPDHAATLQELMDLSQQPPMMLSSLHIEGTKLVGDAEINDIVDDSRAAKPGNAFMCLPRACDQADEYADAAHRAGASAIILVGCVLNQPPLPVLYIKDMQTAGMVLRKWFRTESTPPLVGITGTDGKTSCAWMLREALERLMGDAWSIGTLGWMRSREVTLPIPNTTPSLLIMHRLLAAASAIGVSAIVSEVSSHGIKQERIAGVPFTAALWTTLGNDHLQDFGGFAGYADCKAGFIKQVATEGRVVVANADDAEVSQRLPESALRYGCDPDRPDLALGWRQNDDGDLILSMEEHEVRVDETPTGEFHAENLAAVGLVLHSVFQTPLEQLPQLLSHMSTPTGRMQRVASGVWKVFVDYAHTPEALERCLESGRAMSAGRLLLVFGCGGERSREKRPMMGRVAADLADVVWVTSDNPRGEEPSLIAAEIVHGVPESKLNKLRLQLDRGQAIAEAIEELNVNDILIIAGKGHEPEMEIGGRKFPWSDYDVATNCLSAKKHPDLRACA